MSVLGSGIVLYAAGGGEAATYTLSLSGGAVGGVSYAPGDVIVAAVENGDYTAPLVGGPSGASQLVQNAENPTGNQWQGGVWTYEIPATGVPAGLNWTWSKACRGNITWTLVRGHTAAGAVASVQAWGTSTSATAPAVTATAGAQLIGGVSIASGSATWTLPAGWTELAPGLVRERHGLMAYRSALSSAGTTGTSAFTISNGSPGRRAWVIMLPAATVEPADPPLIADIVSDPWLGASDDVADGAAIIPDPANPGNSVFIGTNKDTTGGLAVYDMSGAILSRQTGFGANSVDWRDTSGFSGWDGRILVMTTNRNPGSYGLRFFWFDRTTRALTAAGTISLGYEPYGTTMGIVGGVIYAYVSERGLDDTSSRNVYQYQISRSENTVSIGSAVRTISIPSVVEGMTIDDATGRWFISNEDVGLFVLNAAVGGGNWASRATVDLVGPHLIADVEEVAFLSNGQVLVSSQGDSSYHVYSFDGDSYEHEQRFTITKPASGGQVTGTDGLDAYLGNLGPSFPHGLIVVHDSSVNPSRFVLLRADKVFGELSVSYPLTGTVVVSSSTQGSLTASRPLAGVVAAVTAVQGAPTASYVVQGIVAVSSGAQGLLRASTPLSGTVVVSSGAQGSPGMTRLLSGVVSATSDVSGSPVLRRPISGTSSVVSAVASPTPTMRFEVAGLVGVVSAFQGFLAGDNTLQGVVVVSSAVPAPSPRISSALAGQVLVQSAVSGEATLRRPLAGVASVTTQVQGVPRLLLSVSAEVMVVSRLIGTVLHAHALSGRVEVLSGLRDALSPTGPTLELLIQGQLVRLSRNTLTLMVAGQETTVGLSVMLDGEEHKFWTL